MSEPFEILSRVLGVAIGFPVVAFALGWSVVGRMAWLDRTERFASAWGVGFALMGTSQFVAFVLHVDSGTFNRWALGAAILVALGLRLIPKPVAIPPSDEPAPVGVWLLGLAHLAAIQWILPIYIGGGWANDWWMHYEEALVFLGKLPITTKWVDLYDMASRTPLYNLVTASVMSQAGDGFWVYQLASVLTNGVFVLPASLVLRDLWGPRAARLGLLLIPMNLWLLHEAWFTWSKMLTAYYVFLGLHFYLRWLKVSDEGATAASRCFLAFWVASLLGFMTHQVGGVYMAPLLLHAAIVGLGDRRRRPGLVDLVILGVVALILVAPWHAWLAYAFGVSETAQSNPTATMYANFSLDRPSKLLNAYGHNMLATFVPDRILGMIANGPWLAGSLYIFITGFYFCQVPGLLTISLMLSLPVGRWRGSFSSRDDTSIETSQRLAVILFAILGASVASVLQPGVTYYGIAHSALLPSAVILAAWGWGTLSRFDRRSATLACAGIAAEFLLVFWSFVAWSYYYVTTGRVSDDLNWLLKQKYHMVLLHDTLRHSLPIAIVVCLVIQAGLGILLVGWARSARLSASRLSDGG